MEGDDRVAADPALAGTISIHSLRVEGDKIAVKRVHNVFCISIHSLRVEGDGKARDGGSGEHHFNPLPPCGGRRHAHDRRGRVYNFNPLPPCGGRRGTDAQRERCPHFNPLPPCGGRPLYQAIKKAAEHFNPLPPCGGRPWDDWGMFLIDVISIHSLRVEGDAGAY